MVIPAGFEVRNLNRRDCPLGRSLVSVEKEIDEISATGGHRFLSHGRRVFESHTESIQQNNPPMKGRLFCW